MKPIHFFIISLAFLFSCKKDSTRNDLKTEQNLLQYAHQISMTETTDSVFIHSGNEKLAFSKNELPLKTTMVVPTVVFSYLDELGLIEVVKGISQPDFVFNPKIGELFQQKKIEEIGAFDEIFVEKIRVSKPDLFISSSQPGLAKYHQLIKNVGIKILYIDEYNELNPLARAEYVKIFGKLFGKEKEAETVFNEIEKNYKEIISKVKESKIEKPSVFANQIYGDVWYIPGGKSFQAGLIADAGGNYLWENDDSETSIKLSFESVFEKAVDADIWINAGDYPGLKALLGSYKNYEWFAAVKNKKVYNWNKRANSKGANDYFETGTARPDKVLNDLAAIFYPEIFPGYDLFFYKKLE